VLRNWNAPTGWLLRPNGKALGWLVPVGIWMTVAPLPVFALLLAALLREVTIIFVPFRPILSVRAVFAVVPLMPITVVPIVVPLVVLFVFSTSFVLMSVFFTLGVSPNCHWCNKGGSQEK
jgi:hypothetical protein